MGMDAALLTIFLPIADSAVPDTDFVRAYMYWGVGDFKGTASGVLGGDPLFQMITTVPLSKIRFLCLCKRWHICEN
jgi:hypothetical protein